MVDLGAFTTEERDLLASLPYRVGAWISHVDDDGACSADEKEVTAIKKVIQVTGKRHDDKTAVDDIARECLLAEGMFDIWEKRSESLLSDVKVAVEMLRTRVSTQEADDFGEFLMEVGTSVAKAFREEGYGWDEEKTSSFDFSNVSERVSLFLGKVAPSSKHGEMNISPEEDTALTDLAKAVRI